MALPDLLPSERDEPDRELSDDELTVLALAADPCEQVGDDAVAVDLSGGRGAGAALLPDWYMPVPQVHGANRPRVMVFSVVVLSLLVLNGLGLCVTYGKIVIAWGP